MWTRITAEKITEEMEKKIFRKLIRSDQTKGCKLGQNAENNVLLMGF